jgi:hypothetical protein
LKSTGTNQQTQCIRQKDRKEATANNASHVRPALSEVAARTRVGLGDIVLALASGLAGAAYASLTASPSRRRALRVQVQSIAELAERTIESAHDRSRFDSAWRVCAKLSTQSRSYSEGQKR